MAPRKSEGAKTPPDPPEPMVMEVAAILATISAASVMAGSWLVSAALMVLYPTPYTLGSQIAMQPTNAPPSAARRGSGTGVRSKKSSVR